MKDVPVVLYATEYTSSNGRNYILLFNEELYMEDMEHTLISSNQFRNFGAEVQDNPYYQKNPMTITSPDKYFVACLQSEGTVVFLDTWYPTQGDLEVYPHI